LTFEDLFIYFREKKQRAGAGGGAQEEGQRESQADSVLSAEPDLGLDPTTHEIMT